MGLATSSRSRKTKSREPRDLALLTYREVAELCSMHVRTVARAVERGDLVSVNAPGTRGHKGKRITRRSLEAFQDSQPKPAQEKP